MNRTQYAKHLGMPGAGNYLRHLERQAREEQASGDYSLDPPRARKLCQALMGERKRLGFSEGEAVEPAPEGSHGEEAEGKDGPWALDHDLLKEHAAEIADLRLRVERLEAGDRGARAAELQPHPISYGTPYLSMFSRGRWKTHGQKITPQLIERGREIIIDACEVLGFFASAEDREGQAAARRKISPLMVEIMGAIEAYSQKHAHEVIPLIETWRKFIREFPSKGTASRREKQPQKRAPRLGGSDEDR